MPNIRKNMTGLLDSGTLGYIGAGLLANSGPSLTPTSPGRGVMQGLLASRQDRQYQQQMQLQMQQQQMMMQRYQQQMAEAQRAQQEREARQRMIDQYRSNVPEKDRELFNLDPMGYVTEARKRQFAEPKPRNPEHKLTLANGQQYMATDEELSELMGQGATFYKAPLVNINTPERAPAGYRWNPDNPAELVKIVGGPAAELNKDQAAAAGFYGRMAESSAVIDEIEGKGYDPSTAGAQFTPNWAQTPEGQQYNQAQENWIRANLRRESGAVIGADEMKSEIKNYFPQLNDSPAVRKQKRNSRKQAEAAMRVSGRVKESGDPDTPTGKGGTIYDKYPNLVKPPQ